MLRRGFSEMKNVLKRFRRDDRGNVSLMFAVSFTASLIGIAAAIDLALVQKSQSQLQSMTDAAVIAATQFDGTDEEKRKVFDEYLNSSIEASGYQADIVSTDIVLDFDGATISLEARVEASHPLMMMQIFNDFDGVRSISTAEMGINDVELALVLDISSSMGGNRITEAKNSAKFFVDSLLDDRGINKRISVSLVPFGGTVRVPAEMNYLLETPAGGLGGYAHNWIDGEFNHCFEFDTADIENGIDLDRQYRATPDFWSWNDTNPWCPTAGNEFVPLTDDKELLFDRIDALTLSDGTGSDHGMLWGYEMLNPAWKNRFPGGLQDTPASRSVGSRETKKVIVFMTDGGITAQHHVRESDRVGEPPFNSKRRTRVSFNNSLNTFYDLCDKAKDNEIEVYTLGYTITKSKHITPLKTCASSEAHYVNATSGNLQSVFSSLATAISPLRISN